MHQAETVPSLVADKTCTKRAVSMIFHPRRNIRPSTVTPHKSTFPHFDPLLPRDQPKDVRVLLRPKSFTPRLCIRRGSQRCQTMAIHRRAFGLQLCSPEAGSTEPGDKTVSRNARFCYSAEAEVPLSRIFALCPRAWTLMLALVKGQRRRRCPLYA
ncbi:hypothetical protein BDV96DRAFT_592585 [Lophiotrema nucula]|uniref:Uncharacterized protein n=1 Tax=Lophiotrema nucula TaxID=690887 RepID=A0A6A5YDN6_9PLEO|nr:hypothetical protein BDV96DRAFT_592585 [Lophiotrema nucula]